MKVGIMQPYFFPYIGYFHLINAVDKFVVYDNVQYTKKGWITRNRLLQNGQPFLFSIPLKKDSYLLDIKSRELSEDFKKDKLLNQIKEVYKKAPYFEQSYQLIEQIIRYEDKNLFKYIFNSIQKTCEFLQIETELVISSSIPMDHNLKNQEKVISICETLHSNTYYNAIGGIDLYSKEQFQQRGIDLKFIQAKPFEYKQFNNEFIPWLSIIDVIMFNSLETIRKNILNNYEEIH